MNTEITLKEKLGKGGYGSVYKCVDGTGDIFAIKKIKMDEHGINCLMELAIMNSFEHPYLTNARHIHIENEYVYIFMDLAKCDMNNYHKLYGRPSISQIRKWSFQLIEAVHCLHSQQIIHCDIKASNILLYDDNVKLCDYTLAIKKWKKNVKYRHTICTCTHRPLEVFLNREWDESVDIWSLGCSLYEIAYGEIPFPYQGEGEKTENRTIKEKCINCIVDWAERESNQFVNVSKRNTDFICYKRNPLYDNPDYAVFKDLINKMLKINPKERLTTNELLQHPFFNTTILQKYKFIDLEIIQLPDSDLTLYENGAISLIGKKEKLTDVDKTIIDVGRQIFKRCGRLTLVAKNLRITCCLYIASKIVSRVPIDLGELKKKVLEVEKMICTNLNYKFCFNLE
jgi:serine/threonine protein kinase